MVFRRQKGTADSAAAREISRKLEEYSALEKYILLSRLKTREKGLDIVDVQQLSDQYPSNEISHEKPKPWYVQLVDAFLNPFTGILLVIESYNIPPSWCQNYARPIKRPFIALVAKNFRSSLMPTLMSMILPARFGNNCVTINSNSKPIH